MALPGNKFFIHSSLHVDAPHHESFRALWESKWKKPCEMGVYPFMFGAIRDFEPVVERLVKEEQKPPYDWDAYAAAFKTPAEELVAKAESALLSGRREEACELFLRASAVYRISRFPVPRSPLQRAAWTAGKAACAKGLALLPYPVHEVQIPHTHGLTDEGPQGRSEGATIPVYHCLPPSATAETPAPCVVIFTGLDGYRTELAVWCAGFADVGVATVIVEIPGTGDCPSDRTDPTAGERLVDSVLEWIAERERVDEKRLVAWGVSTGGYQAARVAHTHPDSFLGVAAHGGGAHYMFDSEWLDGAQKGEYPFDLAGALAVKFGYGDDLDRFKREGQQKWSLKLDGTLEKRCGKLLIVNGYEDGIFPADDALLVCEEGGPKELRLVRGSGHMGEPESFTIILRWIYKLFGIEADPKEQLKTLPFNAKYP